MVGVYALFGVGSFLLDRFLGLVWVFFDFPKIITSNDNTAVENTAEIQILLSSIEYYYRIL